MATFGNKIAGVRGDGSVDIYDSVTGVPRLSLSLANPAQVMRGSPDGSMLFCAHETPSVTVWDMQTGGLIHTVHLPRNAEDIALSSKGRYIACGLSDGTLEAREVANSMEATAIWSSSPVTRFCWLEPEERLAVSTRALVRIWDIVTGTLLRSFTIRYPADRMAYSQRFNQLAIIASSGPENAITIVNPQTGISTTSHWTHHKISCFAFSHVAKELVCGTEMHGLWLFDVLAQRLEHTEYPDTMTSVSCLQNGTVVAKFAGSGIQLLSLDGRHTPPQRPAVSALTVDVFDQDRIIAVLTAGRDHISLLELATMSQLHKIPVGNTSQTSTDHTAVLCASHKNLMVVYYFEEGGKRFLQLWRFHEKVPRWTVEVDCVPETCRISPTAVRLMTRDTSNGMSRICVRNAQNGQVDAQLKCASAPDIEFTSDAEFCSHHDGYRLSYSLNSQGLGHFATVVPPSLVPPQERRYFDVDDAHEWVVSGLKKICWIPPGYIGLTPPSYCWVGYSLLMAGQDGILRKLTFSRDPPEG